ncbi:uncharacterized protein LOC108249148 isoform X3 [Kryptolebias marmoratus]|uniref:uncharacterized protein LOC108249148 isoform X3 n=1 Tax=Kryptolebias marmoratus TaxID=37003 RepID=UPI0018AC90DE|nr:uncharacterized protein LOC108249148 isoform X3 [Kryptolebias marmoratus]
MLFVMVHLLLVFSLAESSAPSAGPAAAPLCPPRWHLFSQKCFAFLPVWSRWSSANSLCAQAGGGLVSLDTPEEMQFVLQLVNSSTPVWVGWYQEPQTGSWLRCDDFSFCDWTNQKDADTREGGACKEMTPKSGELKSAPCGELRFYVCAASARKSLQNVTLSSRKTPEPGEPDEPGEPGLVPGVSLFDVLWDSSSVLAEDILRSSCVFRGFWSGSVTKGCYSRFIQQEALYLHRVSSTLEVLINVLHEADDIKSLLQDTLTRYRRTAPNPGSSPAPQWLQFSLQSFHSVVLEDPVYWLVASSARVCLQNFLTQALLSELGPDRSDSEVQNVYQEWRKENVAVLWLQRYKKVLEKNQDQMDVYKAINIFREQMMNEKRLHKAVTCEDEANGATEI